MSTEDGQTVEGEFVRGPGTPIDRPFKPSLKPITEPKYDVVVGDPRHGKVKTSGPLSLKSAINVAAGIVDALTGKRASVEDLTGERKQVARVDVVPREDT
ncbi:hypothetical protein A2714_04920 [Candidatus Woesebacteria bacterium RIFCSPHIGHO2_01_FULL_38_9]|uniref:Uncharacterized protein n=2 Tax=Candidatus Woeseibacteriota TaxID=1752722 RepID=A0A1F7XY50_9BACT|nr:MAG: hypothetical protein A2714_04920 [Candidatus Woesebacteria bacterium RIFCSPHIGHO2_01_FULL_38_9]OGM59733.1 MAG: hypothetical protein A3A75_02145 [Candidatus Woesebacteria bacterium RIFCSPLOWO2_01_FULL_39_10]